MIKFSIIIPCYNRYKMMGKCLESLEKQEFKDFEVIIIDDASTDQSYEKLNEYKKNSKLKITLLRNEENLGPGKSRNKGIEKATGEFITFLDSDDYIENNTLEILNDVIEKNDVDCILFDYYFRMKNSHIEQKTLLKKQTGKVDKSDALVYSTGSTWGKVYLLENIRHNDIKFPDLRINEDMPFNKLAIAVSQSIYYIDKPLYNYVDNKNSLVYNDTLVDETNVIKAFQILYDKLSEKFPQELEAIFLKQYLYSITLALIKKKAKVKDIKKHIQECEKRYPNIYENESFKYMSKFQQICIFMIKHKMIFILKGTVNLKNLIKKII